MNMKINFYSIELVKKETGVNGGGVEIGLEIK